MIVIVISGGKIEAITGINYVGVNTLLVIQQIERHCWGSWVYSSNKHETVSCRRLMLVVKVFQRARTFLKP